MTLCKSPSCWVTCLCGLLLAATAQIAPFPIQAQETDPEEIGKLRTFIEEADSPPSMDGTSIVERVERSGERSLSTRQADESHEVFCSDTQKEKLEEIKAILAKISAAISNLDIDSALTETENIIADDSSFGQFMEAEEVDLRRVEMKPEHRNFILKYIRENRYNIVSKFENPEKRRMLYELDKIWSEFTDWLCNPTRNEGGEIDSARKSRGTVSGIIIGVGSVVIGVNLLLPVGANHKSPSLYFGGGLVLSELEFLLDKFKFWMNEFGFWMDGVTEPQE